jgi:hypothetical protein
VVGTEKKKQEPQKETEKRNNVDDEPERPDNAQGNARCVLKRRKRVTITTMVWSGFDNHDFLP